MFILFYFLYFMLKNWKIEDVVSDLGSFLKTLHICCSYITKINLLNDIIYYSNTTEWMHHLAYFNYSICSDIAFA